MYTDAPGKQKFYAENTFYLFKKVTGW
jgi:hypothetical protein